MMSPNINHSLFNVTDLQQEMNGSSTSSTRCFVNDSARDKALRVAGYSIIILISMLGNSLVVAVIYRYKKMRKTTNIFIANMAVADLIITAVYMPRLIVMYLIGSTWIEGTVGLILCKIVPFLHGVSLLVSILTLLLISIERLCALLFPLKFIFNSKRMKIAITIIWVAAILARVPYLLALRTKLYPNGRTLCVSNLKGFFGKEEARDIYYSILLAVFYALPLVLIIVSYLVIIIYLRKSRAPGSRLTSQQLDKRRVKAIRNVVRMMIVVTFAFIACWITYFVAQLVFNNVPCALRFWRLFLAHSNSALNPCLYVFFNIKFRQCFVKIIVDIFSARETRNGKNFTQSENRKSSAKENGDEPKNTVAQRLRPLKQTDKQTANVDITAKQPNDTMQISTTTRL